jgi:FAD/FMN-containing dehydrogenase
MHVAKKRTVPAKGRNPANDWFVMAPVHTPSRAKLQYLSGFAAQIANPLKERAIGSMQCTMHPALEELVSTFADVISLEPNDLEHYGRDWTRVFAPSPSAVALPRTVDQVQQIMRICHRHRFAVVPSGGRTGLAGGAMSTQGELVLSLERLKAMDPVDEIGATVRVQAGAVTESVHHHARDFGLQWPIDFAAKGSSQVGGNIATNAGGVRVIRYGNTRKWVLGLEVVLADGTLLDMSRPLEKNNTGIDLQQLFIGSEGTLGVIVGATLKLTPLPKKSDVVLFALSDLPSVLAIFSSARKSDLELSAFEFFRANCLARVQQHRELKPPFGDDHPYFALVEFQNADSEKMESWAMSELESNAVDGVLAQHGSERESLWALRESISESLSATGLPHKNDISVPVAELVPFCNELDALFAQKYGEFEICLFGHIGDGNLHVNVMKPEALSKESFVAKTSELDQTLFLLVQKHRGSISAEHGIGLLKKPYLHFIRSPSELASQAAIKRALDPLGILNPGKVFA